MYLYRCRNLLKLEQKRLLTDIFILEDLGKEFEIWKNI